MNSEQPIARGAAASGAVRIVLHPIPSPDSRTYIVAVGQDLRLWFTENFANRIGRMTPKGEVVGEYLIEGPNVGARAIIAHPNGRLYFSAHDAGAIGEVIPGR